MHRNREFILLHVDTKRIPEARNAPTFRALSGRILLRLAVGKACGRVKGGLNFGSRRAGKLGLCVRKPCQYLDQTTNQMCFGVIPGAQRRRRRDTKADRQRGMLSMFSGRRAPARSGTTETPSPFATIRAMASRESISIPVLTLMPRSLRMRIDQSPGPRKPLKADKRAGGQKFTVCRALRTFGGQSPATALQHTCAN